MQFLAAFQAVHDQLTHLADSLKFTMKSRKARLAWKSLQIYAIARGLARDGSRPSIAAYVDNIRRPRTARAATKDAPTSLLTAALSIDFLKRLREKIDA